VVAPVGHALEITDGDQRAVVTESGATLRVYEVGDRPVVEAFNGPDTVIVGCQGEILAPWPNRTENGVWTWGGTTCQLSITEPDRGHAIHGLVRTLRWETVDHGPAEVVLETTLLAHPGWPFPLHFAVRYALGDAGLTSTITATNIGEGPCPYGVATHPYLAVPGGTVDDVALRIPAATWVETDERLIPVGRRATTGTLYEFDGVAPVGDRQVDHAFTDLARLPDGRVEASLLAQDGSVTTLWGDSSVRWWQLFTGDALPERWRRSTLALEPMTCAPNALNTGEDLVILDPGASHSMTWGVRLS
jgi:aldose 1-epimerase